MIHYTPAEVDAIVARHMEAQGGMRLIGLMTAAFSGFLVALVLCALAWAQGWLV